MKRLVTLLSLFLSLSSAARAQLRGGSCNVYSGTLGESEIGMILSVRGRGLEGVYFDRKSLKDIPLKGSVGDARDITLDALHGTFRLHLAEHDPRYRSAEVLQGEVLQGVWTIEEGGRFPVSLRLGHSCNKLGSGEYEIAGAKDDAQVEKNVQAFYRGVLQGNRNEVAKYISYPCTFIREGKRASIRDESDLLKNYDAIFMKEFVEKIASGVPHHMFANYQGIMIADGAVWFNDEGKARNFNNSATP
jgi:hypothetical protein